MVCVRGELAMVQFCAMVAGSGFMDDVVEWREVCVVQAGRSSADALGLMDQSRMGLVLICVWILVVGCRWRG